MPADIYEWAKADDSGDPRYKIPLPHLYIGKRTVLLTGELAAAVGTDRLEIDVARPCDAIRAVTTQHPAAMRVILDGNWQVLEGGRALEYWELFVSRPDGPDVSIIPAPAGAGDDGIGKIFAGLILGVFTFGIGAALGPAIAGVSAGWVLNVSAALPYMYGAASYIALSGVSQALAPSPPSNYNDREAAGSRTSTMFGAAHTVKAAGEPIPLAYGRNRIAGLQASVSVDSGLIYGGQEEFLVSSDRIRNLDIVSDGTIVGLVGARRGILVDGTPMENAASGTMGFGLHYTVRDGNTGDPGSFTSSATPYFSKMIPFRREVKKDVPVEIEITDENVTHVPITLQWPVLADFSGTGYDSAEVEYTVEIKSGSGSYQSAAGRLASVPGPVYNWDQAAAALPTAIVWSDWFDNIDEIASLDVIINSIIWTTTSGDPDPEQTLTIYWRAYDSSTVAPDYTETTKTVTLGPKQTNASGGTFSDCNEIGEVVSIDWTQDGSIDYVEFYAEVTATGNDGGNPYSGLAGSWSVATVGYSIVGKMKGLASGTFQQTLDTGALSQYGTDYPYRYRISRTTDDQDSESRVRDAFYVFAYSEQIREPMELPYTATIEVLSEPDAVGSSVPDFSYVIDGRKVQIPNGATYDVGAGTATLPETWDGTFVEGYTNDPAWVLYDLLTDTRAGMGIPAANIDKWSFMEASRRNCEEVSNMLTGSGPSRVLELRYRFNYSFTRQDQALKAAVAVATSMDAQIWMGGGIIYLSQDKVSTASRIFNESNVVDGLFSYMGTARPSRISAVNVSWRDPAENYEIRQIRVEREYVADRYGKNEIDVDAIGITCYGQAIRRARYMLLTNELETETVSFAIGPDNALVAPGEVISIMDSHKNQKITSGRLGATAINSGSYTWIYAAIETGDVTTGSSFVCQKTDGSLYEGTVESVDVAGNQFGVSPQTTAAELKKNSPYYWTLADTAEPTTWRVLQIAEVDRARYEVTAAKVDSTKWEKIDLATDRGSAFPVPTDTWPPS